MTGLLLPKPGPKLPAERRRIASVSKRPSAQDRALADRLCSALVKAKAMNKCEASGYAGLACSKTLDWAHGIPRRYLSVRWAHTNSACLCRVHHDLFTVEPAMFERWRILKFGGGVLDDLAERARAVGYMDVAAVVAGLKAGRFCQCER